MYVQPEHGPPSPCFVPALNRFTQLTPALQVPLSSLRRTTRERKYALDAIEAALRRLQPEDGAARSREEHVAVLDSVAQELETWQHKVRSAWGTDGVRRATRCGTGLPALLLCSMHQASQTHCRCTASKTLAMASQPFRSLRRWGVSAS